MTTSDAGNHKQTTTTTTSDDDNKQQQQLTKTTNKRWWQQATTTTTNKQQQQQVTMTTSNTNNKQVWMCSNKRFLTFLLQRNKHHALVPKMPGYKIAVDCICSRRWNIFISFLVSVVGLLENIVEWNVGCCFCAKVVFPTFRRFLLFILRFIFLNGAETQGHSNTGPQHTGLQQHRATATHGNMEERNGKLWKEQQWSWQMTPCLTLVVCFFYQFVHGGNNVVFSA